MAVRVLLSIFIGAIAFGCSTNRTKDGKRVGLWIEKDTIAGVVQTIRGRYRDGMEKRTWKTFSDGRLSKKEIYRDSICHVFQYGKNGVLEREGYTRISAEGQLTHWFYFGDWFSYDTLGNITSVDTYYRGELVGEKYIEAQIE